VYGWAHLALSLGTQWGRQSVGGRKSSGSGTSKAFMGLEDSDVHVEYPNAHVHDFDSRLASHLGAQCDKKRHQCNRNLYSDKMRTGPGYAQNAREIEPPHE
jgi:hypothetical protein